MATLLVIGASQGIGLETVKRALAAGDTVRALARRADAIALDDPRLSKITGDATLRADVDRAITDVDAVVMALGVGRNLGALLGGTDLFSRATRVVVDAMTAASVRRLIAVTGLGAGDSRGHGGFLYDAVALPLVLKRVYDDKDVQEMMIRRSQLEWTIVRPGILTSGPATGRYRVLDDPADWRMGSISRADVADFLVREAHAPAHTHRTPLIIA